jgi:hypothetical protein
MATSNYSASETFSVLQNKIRKGEDEKQYENIEALRTVLCIAKNNINK